MVGFLFVGGKLPVKSSLSDDLMSAGRQRGEFFQDLKAKMKRFPQLKLDPAVFAGFFAVFAIGTAIAITCWHPARGPKQEGNEDSADKIRSISMLVLTRKENEKILIGEDITITVVLVAGNKVRIGIEAPDDVVIRREEVVAQWANN